MKRLQFIACLVLLAAFLAFPGAAPAARGQGGETPVPSNPDSRSFSARTILLPDGKMVEEMIIAGPPQPPPGSELERPVVTLPDTNAPTVIVSLEVPAYEWSFGCSATSGAMIAAYHDRNGFENIYVGPTGTGVMPSDSSPWPDWTDGIGDTYAQCPLIATHQGLDGRLVRGSIDDYWVSYLSSASDPYLTNGWAQHAWGDAIGDYMRTSQSAFGNVDGSTAFYNYGNSWPFPLTCADMVTNNITNDGTYGRKLFYEARGYTVTDCYNEKTDNNRGLFTLARYKAEIDAGRPVMLNLAGHTVVGVGYETSSNLIYIHDTWDYLTHSMTWGGKYSDMALQSVSIVHFTSESPASCHRLILASAGSGGNPTVSPPNSAGCAPGYYLTSQSVSLTATPDSGYGVDFWTGTDNDSSPSTTNSVTMPAGPRTVTVNYSSSPTAVIVSSFYGAARFNTARLIWETVNEVGLVGFNVYRSDAPDGARQKRNASLIPARRPGEMVGAVYQYDDAIAPGKRYTYWIERVSQAGSELSAPILLATEYWILAPLVSR